MKLGISVIVCCYNSAARLPETIKHLAHQNVPAEIKWEIIVVDNASSDNTLNVAKQEWDKHDNADTDFILIKEPRHGKHNALKLGIESSQYDFIIICDDDNWLNENYVAKSYGLLAFNDKIGAVGGQGIAVSDNELPIWFESFQHGYACGKQAETEGDVTQKKYLWGAGMALRKAAFEKAYQDYNSLFTGRKTDQLTGGEDGEFCIRAIFLGYTLYYSNQLVYKHFMPKTRLTLAYKEQLFKNSITETRIFDLYYKQLEITNLPFIKKGYLLIANMVRLVACLAPIKSVWSLNYETEVLYLLTGIIVKPVSEECISVRRIYRALAAKRL